jgi:hypothetical protein
MTSFLEIAMRITCITCPQSDLDPSVYYTDQAPFSCIVCSQLANASSRSIRCAAIVDERRRTSLMLVAVPSSSQRVNDF